VARRILDRLTPQNSTGLPFRKLWQKTCETIEGQFTDILEALITIDDVTAVTIAADYTGTVTPSDQLPKNVLFKLKEGSTDITTEAAWSVAVDSGSISCSIGASTGVLNITALGSTSVVIVTGVYQGITRTRKLQVNLSTGQVPASGSGGGSSSSTSTFSTINSTSHAAICTLTATAGSGGIVTLSAPLDVTTALAATTVTLEVYGKWQWDSTGGGVWVDLAAEVASNPDCRIAFDSDSLDYFVTDGSLSVPDSKTGLTPGSPYNFRLMARKNSGTRVMSFIGTASAVGS
jgi:hypothetical protein